MTQDPFAQVMGLRRGATRPPAVELAPPRDDYTVLLNPNQGYQMHALPDGWRDGAWVDVELLSPPPGTHSVQVSVVLPETDDQGISATRRVLMRLDGRREDGAPAMPIRCRADQLAFLRLGSPGPLRVRVLREPVQGDAKVGDG
jgi:hypothetical protein